MNIKLSEGKPSIQKTDFLDSKMGDINFVSIDEDYSNIPDEAEEEDSVSQATVKRFQAGDMNLKETIFSANQSNEVTKSVFKGFQDLEGNESVQE